MSDADARYRIRLFYEHGDGVQHCLTEAAAWYRLAAEKGHVEAKQKLEELPTTCSNSDLPSEESSLRAISESGDADAQFEIGRKYVRGAGITQDNAKASKWHLLAAKNGHTEAQYNLGVFYQKGRRVTANLTESANWFRQAAEQGHADAQFTLVTLYQKGRGINIDMKAAIKWYTMAANQGHPDAQLYLGKLYALGKEVAMNKTKAKEWYGMACDNGLQDGCDEYRKLNKAGY